MYVHDVFQENWEILLCLIPPLHIEVPVPGQESQRICVLGVIILHQILRFLMGLLDCFDSMAFFVFLFFFSI